MNETWEKLQKIAEESGGIIKTAQVENEGIGRTALKKYVDESMLVRESQGIYTVNNNMIDEYKLLQARSRKLVYSYGTALYLHEMSDRVPHTIDVSVPQGYNGSRIKKENPDVRFHYVKKKLWELGIEEIRTSLGNMVYVYNKERCICDLVRDKKQMDTQIYAQAIKEYFVGEYNTRKIIKYSREFGIEDAIRNYMEVLS
ncbi:MAG: abortive infection protein [Peptostreptococcaceae bacterium]|nr:abortive infection protein [Peptostreptococcaceae bacterium]